MAVDFAGGEQFALGEGSAALHDGHHEFPRVVAVSRTIILGVAGFGDAIIEQLLGQADHRLSKVQATVFAAERAQQHFDIPTIVMPQKGPIV